VPDIANALCYPVCHACGVAGVCARASEAIAVAKKENRKRRVWSPNQLPIEKLTCGHLQIPWPITKIFGANITTVSCEECGTEVPYVEPKPATRSRKKAKADDTEPIPF
jgi:hypothetical protein